MLPHVDILIDTVLTRDLLTHCTQCYTRIDVLFCIYDLIDAKVRIMVAFYFVFHILHLVHIAAKRFVRVAHL